MLRWGKDKSDQAAPPPAAAASTDTSPAQAAGVPGRAPEAENAQISLPELLLREGQVPKYEMDRALQKQKETGTFLGEILVEQGTIDEKSLLSFLTKHCKIPHLSLLDYLIDKSIISLLPKEICLKYRLIPIDKLGRNLTVAMVNPLDHEALETVRQLCPELRIKPILCAYKHFEIVTNRLFRPPEAQVELSASMLGLTMPMQSGAPAPAAEAVPAPAPAAIPAAPDQSAPPPAEESAEESAEDLPAPEEIPEAEEVPEVVEPVLRADTPPPPVDENDRFLGRVFRNEAGEEPAADDPPRPQEGSSALMQEMASVMMDSMRDTYAMLARRMELFRGLNPEEVARIFSHGATVEFDEGQTIFEKGDAGDSMYVLLGGKVMIMDEGRELATVERGNMFGEMGLISNRPRSASAHAITFASCLVLSREVIQNVMPRDVAVQLLVNIVVTLSERLRAANARLESGAERMPSQLDHDIAHP